MGRRLVVLLLVGASARAQEADFSVEAIRKRIEVLRPDLEAVLGAPLGGPVEVVVTTPDALKEQLAKELVALRGGITGGPRGEELEKACSQEAGVFSHLLVGKVELKRDVLHICPDNLRTIAALDDSWKGMLGQDFLDVILLHEMVHVFQQRRFGLERFFGAPSSLEQMQACGAVTEGHAQHVAREAARRRGLEGAFALLVKTQTEVPASVKDPAMRHVSEVVGTQLAFAYVDGEKFFHAIAEKLGYEKALERVFSSPPTTLRAISRPEEYLSPPAPDTTLEDLASRLQRLLLERGGTAQIIPLALPMLRATLAPAGPEVVERAARGFNSGVAVVGKQGNGQVIVGFLAARDEEAATLLYEADVAATKAKDRLFGKQGGQIRVAAARYRPLSIEGSEGLEVEKFVDLPFGRQRLAVVVVHRRGLVIEAMAMDVGAGSDFATRLVREALELVRGTEVADPWDGKSGDEARSALIGALSDPQWGVRWRATRNLGRLKAPEIDASLVRMLKDPDAAVRCAALRGLLARGWLDHATEEERGALAADPDWEVALTYYRAMVEHGADATTKASHLLKALEDPHPVVRAYAFEKLDDIKEQDQIPWARLRAGIEDVDADVRVAAIRTLGWHHLQPGTLGLLVKALRDDEPAVRIAAASWFHIWASPESLRQSPEAVDALMQALGDDASTVRWDAAEALQDAGSAAAPAVPALTRLLADDLCREPAAEALGKIGVADPEAMRKLDAALSATDLDFRFEAARALWRLGRPLEPLLPVFVETLRRGGDYRRDDAAEVLGELGESSRSCVDDLVAALKDKKPRVGREAARALGKLGAVAKEALPALDAFGGKEEAEPQPSEDPGAPAIGLGGGTDEADVRRAAREAAKEIRAALAK